MTDKLTAFFVTPIGEENSSARNRADRVLQFVLNETLEDEYTVVRADHVTSLGSINHDIINRLYNSDLVVADLTGTNPNVMYEVGIRHSFNKPIIQIAQSGQDLPFDLGQERTLFFDLGDIQDVSEAKRKIRGMVEASRRETYEGPVLRTLGLSAIFHQDRPIAEAISDLTEKIDDLESAVYVSGMSNNDGIHVEFPGDVESQVAEMHAILSEIRPYEATKIIDFVRRQIKKP